MSKTIEDFKKAAATKNITRWNIHDCSICGYPCGFIIEGDAVYYDSGCDCVPYTNIQPRTWADVAGHYNRNAGASDVEERMKQYPAFKDAVKHDNEFWGFEEPAPTPNKEDA